MKEVNNVDVITNREQLDSAAHALLSELNTIQTNLEKKFFTYSDKGKILKVTLDFYKKSLDETVKTLKEKREQQEGSPEINALMFEREKLFYFNLELIIDALRDISEQQLTHQSKEITHKLDDVISEIAMTRQVNEFMRESINHENHINEKKFIKLAGDINQLIEAKKSHLKETNNTNLVLLEKLRKTMSFLVLFSLVKIAQLANLAKLQIPEIPLGKILHDLQKAEQSLQKKTAHINKAEIARVQQKKSEVQSLKTNLFTAKRSKEIAKRISDLTSPTSFPSPKKS